MQAPGTGDYLQALALGLVSVFAIGLAAPLGQITLPPVRGFLPAYQSAVILLDIATAALIFLEFVRLRSRRLLWVAAAYVFSATMAAEHALSFPGLFSASGLMGSGEQTTAWLYFIWHLGFPAALCVYALDGQDSLPATPVQNPSSTIAVVAICACLVAVMAMLLTTAGHAYLPSLMQGNSDLPAKYAVAGLTCGVTVASLVLLVRRSSRSVLDVWLMMVSIAWLCDVALAALFNAGRYSVGWYAGRVYGLFASGFVLAVFAWKARAAARALSQQ
jgi:hypothetical protein